MTKTSCNVQHSVDSDSKEPIFRCRYIIAIIGFLIFLLLSVHRTVMSVAIVAMVNNSALSRLSDSKSDSCPSLLINETQNESFYVMKKEEGQFVWSPHVQGYVLGSYFFGYFISQIPAGMLAERYGCKWPLFTASLVTGFLTLLIPPIAWLSVSALIAVQAMRGLAQGLVQPSMAILTSNWFPKMERGFVYSLMASAVSLGPFLGSIFTGYICDSPAGWPCSFYTVGAAGLTLSVSIILSVAENPKVHSNISKAELDFILSNQECILNKKRPKQPWCRMLTSIPVYALASGYIGRVWAISQFWIVQSTFLGTILHYSIAENGIFTAIPFLVQFLCCQIGSCISFYMQNKNVASVDFLRKFWTYISALGYSGCLLGMYFSGCNRPYSIIFSIMSMGFIGLGTPGITPVATDMTPTFTGSLHALINTTGYTSSFILPVIVGHLTDGMQTIEQWNKVFFISIGVVLFSKTVFVIFGSADVQPWNFVGEITEHKEEKQTESSKKNNGSNKNEEMTRF